MRSAVALEMVAFDGDDTLWHHERLFSDIASRFSDLLGHHVGASVIDERLLDTERRNLRHYGYGVKGYGLSLIETALDITGGDISGEDVATMLGWIKEMLADPIELLPGVEETVDALVGRVRLGIVTKGDLFDQEGKIARSGIADRFEQIAIVSEKDPDTYSRVFGEWDVAPTALLMVGNSVRSDILPILALGGSAIHVPYDLTWEHEVVVERVEDFPVLEDIRDVLDHVRDRLA